MTAESQLQDPREDRDAGAPGDGAPDRRVPLLSLPPEALRETVGGWMEERGHPSYRVEQVENWVFDQRGRRFREMTTLPEAMREELARDFSLTPLEVAWTARSEDGTVKHLWGVEGGARVESVLIPTPDRLTLCLSSQSGCALGCRFCATGSMGFEAQLGADEIAAQFRNADRFAREEMGREISNVVYMGMGEPFANREAVFRSLEVLHEGFGIGARRITVSTVGIVPGILEMAERPEQFGLAVSLHAPVSEVRAEIMPVEERYPLPELMDAIRTYQDRKGRRVSIEYTLIEGINDSPDLARELAGLLEGLTCFVNLIPWNPIPDRDWAPSPDERIHRFARVLHREGISNAVRTPRGRDIAAACGQLQAEQRESAA
jgi:23S rRNA (adenine2503-C2)-methyltransferase